MRRLKTYAIRAAMVLAACIVLGVALSLVAYGFTQGAEDLRNFLGQIGRTTDPTERGLQWLALAVIAHGALTYSSK